MKKPSYASTPARVVASQALLQVIDQQRSLSDVLIEYKTNATARDGALIQELSFGVCRYYHFLQVILLKLLNKPLRRKDRVIEMLMLTALYQLQHSTTPAHTIINETVAACDELKMSFAKGLVNVCLRRFLREPELNHVDDMIALSHPKWMQDKLIAAWPQNAVAIMQENNQRPPMTLRVDTEKISRATIIEACKEAGAIAHPLVNTAVILAKPMPVNNIFGFEEGYVSVQDAASQLAAPLLNLQSGMRVLDACAAPGGKTVHILQSADHLQVTALDISLQRLKRVEENCQRGKVQAILKAADALQLATWWDGELFDRILLDAPCSATGVIRRHPDIKIVRQESDIALVCTIQQKLLTTLMQCVKPGGTLLYSTCSIFPEENHQQIQLFLAENPHWVDTTPQWGQSIWKERVPVGMQILPGEMNMDGFYYAVLQVK